MKILITGASGFLGQHLIAQLLNSDSPHHLTLQYRSKEGFENSVKSHPLHNDSLSKIEFRQADLTNQNDVAEMFKSLDPFDICLHLAAISSPRNAEKDPKSTMRSNVPVHLFDMLKDTPIVALSTDQVYCGQKAPYHDDSEVGPLNVYSSTKVEMEKYLMKNQSSSVVCLRSSIILGPEAPFGDAHSTFLHFCKSREGVETTFYTDECRSVINVGDVCNVLNHFVRTVERGQTFESSIYNMGGPHRVSRFDMANMIAKHFSFDASDTFIAAEKANLNQGPDDVASPLDISMSSTKLEKVVGFKFKDLEQTIKETFA